MNRYTVPLGIFTCFVFFCVVTITMSAAENKPDLELSEVVIRASAPILADGSEEQVLSAYFKEKELPVPSVGWPLHEERVEIELHLGSGNASASITGSDLSEEYVKINADYRT